MPHRDSRICRACAFQTTRLAVIEWHSPSPAGGGPFDLPLIVTDMLTEPVTRSLPQSWQGDYSLERARAWIEDRDNEGTTLLVLDRSTGRAIGLIILFETDAPARPGSREVRLGYLLSETAWGKGYASELVEGLVDWCRRQANIISVAGGVEKDNPASRRVLEKNGFRPAQDEGELHQEEELFRLTLRE